MSSLIVTDIHQYKDKNGAHIYFLPRPTSMFQLNVSEADNDGLQMSGDDQITSFQVQHKQLNMRYESAPGQQRPERRASEGHATCMFTDTREDVVMEQERGGVPALLK